VLGLGQLWVRRRDRGFIFLRIFLLQDVEVISNKHSRKVLKHKNIVSRRTKRELLHALKIQQGWREMETGHWTPMDFILAIRHRTMADLPAPRPPPGFPLDHLYTMLP